MNLVALDIETESITNSPEDALYPSKSKITCIGVYSPAVRKVYRAPWDSFKKEIYDNLSLGFVGHNFKFDLKHLAFHLGYELPNLEERYVDDTRFMAFISTTKIPQEYLDLYEIKRKELNSKLPLGVSHREAKLHSLKTLAPYFLDVEPFWEDPTDHNNDEYVLKDCEYTYKLREFFEKDLKESGSYSFYAEKLLPWTKMVLKAEISGVCLDVEEVRKLQQESLSKINLLNLALQKKWKHHFESFKDLKRANIREKYNKKAASAILKNPEKEEVIVEKYSKLLEKASSKASYTEELVLNLDSPAQLKWLLKDRMGLNIKNLEGKESTDKEVLNRLAKENEDIKLLLELKNLTKLTTAFLPKYLELADTKENKIYCDFNIDGTRTGRLSSSRPNLQQHPRKLKHLFKASPGNKLITYDVTAIEPLVMAYYTEDHALTDLIMQGKSLHSVNAIIMFDLDCSEEEVKEKYPELRSIAKTVGLAVLYGAGWRQIQKACQKENIFFTEKQCKNIVDRIRGTYKDVWAFKKALDAELEAGAVIFNLLGRPIKIFNPEDVYMKGLNTLIQSSASDLVLDIGLQICEQTKAKPILFVHDSIVCEVNKDAAEEEDLKVQKIFKRELINDKTTFKLSIEGGVSDVWE